MTRQLENTESNLFERVLRDPQDPRRFYLIYRTLDIKTTVTGKGFYIGQTHIKPTDNTITGYIPFPLYYINKSTLDRLLGYYGHHVTGDFVTTPHGTCIAGYKFKFTPNRAVSPPKTLMYNGSQMDVKYDDDIRQCRYCGRYGHLLRQCRSKAADDKQHQRVRDEALALRTADWKTAREKLAAEYHQEAKELRRHLNEELTASADVFIAAKLALEGQDNCAEQQAHLQQVFNDDHDTINCHASDAAEFLADEVYEQITAIDNKFQKSGGHIPDKSNVNRLMVTPSITPETEEIASMDVDMLIRT